MTYTEKQNAKRAAFRKEREAHRKALKKRVMKARARSYDTGDALGAVWVTMVAIITAAQLLQNYLN